MTLCGLLEEWFGLSPLQHQEGGAERLVGIGEVRTGVAPNRGLLGFVQVGLFNIDGA